MGLPPFLEERGVSVASVDGADLPRHFGDPAREYRAATEGAGVVLRRDRGVLRLHGRAPRQMLQGILTNSVTDPPTGADGGPWTGLGSYGAILTPKGKMVSDLKQYWLANDEDGGIALDVPVSGKAGSLAYFAKFLPPRFATVEDREDWAVITVLGPRADQALAAALGSVSAAGHPPPEAGYELLEGGPLGGGLLLASGMEQVPSWDLILPEERLADLWTSLEGAGAAPVGWGVWDTLRVEGGWPRFGAELTESTIPLEAGLGDRAFDHAKGCYTGQEVIVRIRHRGHVNWHLRSVRFGEGIPQPGDELFEEGGEKVVGRVTSSVQSPRYGQAVGLAYVRREVVPPAELRLGHGRGQGVEVLAVPTEARDVGREP